jgi:hypothetical protein
MSFLGVCLQLDTIAIPKIMDPETKMIPRWRIYLTTYLLSYHKSSPLIEGHVH